MLQSLTKYVHINFMSDFTLVLFSLQICQICPLFSWGYNQSSFFFASIFYSPWIGITEMNNNTGTRPEIANIFMSYSRHESSLTYHLSHLKAIYLSIHSHGNINTYIELIPLLFQSVPSGIHYRPPSLCPNNHSRW